jgi:hypothetical protein
MFEMHSKHFDNIFNYNSIKAGHFATGRTHIDSAVEAVRLITPTGETL